MKNKQSIEEFKFSNANWKKVLKEIVNHAPNRYGRGTQGYTDDHPLAKRVIIKGYELMLIMSFLEEQNLIEYEKPDFNWINITPKGFDVDLGNQTQSSAFRRDFVMIILTAVIAFATAIDVFQKVNDLMIRIVNVAFLVALGFIFWIVSKK